MRWVHLAMIWMVFNCFKKLDLLISMHGKWTDCHVLVDGQNCCRMHGLTRIVAICNYLDYDLTHTIQCLRISSKHVSEAHLNTPTQPQYFVAVKKRITTSSRQVSRTPRPREGVNLVFQETALPMPRSQRQGGYRL
jgi:hypothetical protein